MEISPILLDIDKIFYCPIQDYGPSDELKVICETALSKINKDYKIVQDRIYYFCDINMGELPPSGWKIHISACYWNCEHILKLVVEYCATNRLNFKFYADKKIVFRMNEKSADRGSSGKFITIYIDEENLLLKHLKGLGNILSGIEGPYILTDKKYSGIVYYRYGIFKMIHDLCIINPENGDIFIDDHQPFFNLPYWISDPINEVEEEENDELLNNRYDITEVLRYTNAGGTYVAIDTKKTENRIIKEARPYTCQFGDKKDSVYLKQNEEKILNKLLGMSGVPQVLDSFFDWEHYFIVETIMPGDTLRNYAATNNPFIVPNSDEKEYINYYRKLEEILKKCLLKLRDIHRYNIVVGDISNTNILFDGEEIYFVDFDGSIDLDSTEDQYVFDTISFSAKNNMDVDLKTKDYISLGFVFYSMLVGGSTFLELDKESYERILERMGNKYFLSDSLYKLIVGLIKGQCNDDNILLFIDNAKKEVITKFSELNVSYKKMKIDLITSTIKLLNSDTSRVVSPLLLENNFSFKYGVSGIAYSLIKSKGLYYRQRVELHQYLLNGIQSSEFEDMSFSSGLAGAIFTLLQFDDKIKNINNIENLADKISSYVSYKVNDPNESLNFGEGLSGLAWVLLKVYKIKPKDEYLISIKKVFKRIQNELPLLYNPEKIGFEFGNSGIALFLLSLYKEVGEQEIIMLGEALLISDITSGEIGDNETYMHPMLRDEKDILFPYFSYGTAGITYVALEYFELGIKEKLQDYLANLINGIKVNFTVHLGFEKGESGILYVLCKAARLGFIDVEYVNECLKNIYIQLYREHEDYNLLCPGYAMLRCSIDFGTGSAGLLLALNEFSTLEWRESECFDT